jgi:8-oxo-dGTP pyrophosphatase MutT (NUDIX family)
MARSGEPSAGRYPPFGWSGQNDRVHDDPSQRSEAATTAPEFRMLTTSVVYADQWITLRRDETERRDGFRGSYAYVQKRNFALIIPAENGGFHLVEEYRYPLGRRGWSFPQGGFPHDESGTAEELARLELAQETGLRAARLTHLGTVAAAHGMTNQYGEYFLATGLTPGPSDLEPEELDLRHEWVPRDVFEEMISDRRIVDDSTLAAYTLLLLAERRGDIDLS